MSCNIFYRYIYTVIIILNRDNAPYNMEKEA